MSFFSKHKISKPNCPKCKLHLNCNSPRMEYVGEGDKGILIITEYPTEVEDERGQQLVGKPMLRLAKELRACGIDIKEDCYKVNAVSCRKVKGTATPEVPHINACRPFVESTIKKLKPTKIILLGEIAVQSFYGTRFKDAAQFNKVVGTKLYDSEYKAYVYPLWSPSYLIHREHDDLLHAEFSRRLEIAINHDSTPPKKRWNPIHLLRDYKQAIHELTNVLKFGKLIAIDFESTGLDMWKSGHKTVSFAWADDKGSWAVPVQHPYWKQAQQDEIFSLVKRILRKRAIKKIVQGIDFEYPWTVAQFGVRPNSIVYDTRLASHILDNRVAGSVGLKYQVYKRWGIDYDSESDKYIRTNPATGFNDMLHMPIDALLKYNALDTLYTYELYREQATEFEGDELQALSYLHRGALAFCEMTCNGIAVDVKYYEKQRKKLTRKRRRLVDEILKSKEVVLYNKRFGEFNYDSPKDLQKMLFKVLKLKSVKETKTGHSVDAEVLVKLDIPLTRAIIGIRKLGKIISTYVDGFIRHTENGFMHPSFPLHRVTSYRGCIAGYEKVLVMRDFKQKAGVPIKDIKVGDMVYCFDDNLNPVLRPVTWQGKTGRMQVVRVHWKHKRGVTGHFDCTPDHKVRLIDGTYKEAQFLTDADHVLAGGRRKEDLISFTNLPYQYEHRFIYKQLVGNLDDAEVVHHKDWDHYNHNPTNLEKMSVPAHDNHCIIKVEPINKLVDVYDLEVEGEHNFIVNEICVHNSSARPNWQNVPKRDPVAKKITRAGIMSRWPTGRIGEMDFSGAEINTSCFFHKDPTFFKYQTDPDGGDMHRDAAAEILKIKPSEVPKQARQCTKGVWTFSQFYGSYFKNCAKQGWEEYPQVVDSDGNELLINGVPISQHMKNTFKTYRNFENHLKAFENKFWNEWFPMYTKWKKKVVKFYKKNGYVDTYLGFRFKGYMNKKQCTNYPVQGTSFHLLMYTAYLTMNELRKRKLKTLIVGQIHDSIILDMPEDEVKEVHKMLLGIVGNLHNEFKWMSIPMEMDFEVSATQEEGGTFAKLSKVKV